MDADTAHTLTDVEVIDTAPSAGGMAALLGGLDMGAMLAGLGIEIPDADTATMDDLDSSLTDLHAKLDWLAAVIVATVEKAPARFRPELPGPYPES